MPDSHKKPKKSIFKRAWFWIVVALAAFAVIGALLPGNESVSPPPDAAISDTPQVPAPTAVADPAKEVPSQPAPTADAPVEPDSTVTPSVWISSSGSKYHKKQTYSSMQDLTQLTLDDTKNQGYTACKRCNPPQ